MKLTDAMQATILQHAKDEFPREACGLIAVVKGRRRYFPCRNIARTPDEHFVLDGWHEIEEHGEVVSIVHSHPKTNPRPSTADRVACEKTGLPWFIVNPQTEAWGYCEPEGFELPYIGREFVHGIVDCYSLVRDFFQREYGITLHDYHRRDDWWHNGQNMYVDNFEKEGFSRVPTEEMQRGDLLLVSMRSTVPNHAAIYLGDQQILHHVQGRLSSRDVLGGYYLKSCDRVIRHESRQGLRGSA
ncbi:putative phage cell-wall peptidase [uncultured Mediterranean phage MEDS5 group]|uniref:Putative phage cell-wall peptidase n=1 Tax=uncultured Mediterranean phage MEDS5 group TaxID=1262075 RepID=K7YQ35_9CAUD|nr:putative phage cell-wall peptidase [uncultured Mediterranean phage MEDS5 group]BAR24332.1 putative phage cell-wall peptidase [uncultured Mediterranean phage uvMED]